MFILTITMQVLMQLPVTLDCLKQVSEFVDKLVEL